MTSMHLTAVAFGLALVAAARSTWSPCGISMLSTLTPFSERSRGHRYPVTVAWFVAGATGGGAVLGAAMAALAAAVAAWDPSAFARQAVLVIWAGITIVSDLSPAGAVLPTVPRQVNEVWTGRYRNWVYAAGFGAQIGVGVSTYVMTAAVYLTIGLAAMTGNVLTAFLVGLAFGAARGLAILLGAGLRSPEAIRAFHRRFEAAARLSLVVAIVAQAEVISVVIGSPPAVVAVAVVGLGWCGYECQRLVARHRLERRPA